MQKIKVGDTVEVIAGKDRSVRGEVIRVDNKQRRVVVESVNVAKKHQKPQQVGGRNLEAGIIEFEAAINISNVMIVCPTCDHRARVSFRYDEEGNKVRVCRKCDADID